MKKVLLSVLAALVLAGSASAQNLAGKKIYLNPGHGGFEASATTPIPGQFGNGYRPDGSVATDRWNPSIPFPTVDEGGCWESKHNLWRAIELRRLLENAGATVKMSREQNRPEDDRILVEIGEEATSWGADMFLSIHSNGNGANYLLTIFRGADPRPGQPFNINDPDLPESKQMAITGWKHLHDNPLTCWQGQKNPNSPYAVSDSAFYSSWTEGYHLGVLRKLWVPGYLAEIAFHDYKPETHRMLSEDYSKCIAYMLFTGICDHFNAGMPATGIIAGEAKDAKRIFRDPLFLGATVGDHDQYKPINGAVVTLTGNGVNKTYTTDNYFNGLFYFPDLVPGTYHIKIEAEGYTTWEGDAVCEAAKVRGPIAMMDDPSYDPANDAGAANIYASALTVVSPNTIRFTLNAQATDVTVNLLRNGQTIKTIDLGPQPMGTSTITLPADQIADGDYQWSVTASAEGGLTEPKQFTTNGDAMLEVANTRSVSIDNNPASPFFGRMYATSIASNGKTGARLGTGIYIWDAALADVTEQGGNPYAGGVAWSGNSSPMRVDVAEDGTVYICDWSDSHSGLWIMDPADPTAAFTEFFGGTRNADGLASEGDAKIHGSLADVCVVGSGADTKVYVSDEDMPESFINRYDIGTSRGPWTKAPDQKYGNYDGRLVNANQTVCPDRRGGLWVGQYRYTNSEQYPSVMHINGTTGQYDYFNGNADMIKSSGPVGAMAVNATGDLMAVAGLTDIRVLSISYDANGTPSMSLKYSIGSTYGARPFDVAFDVADNVYVAFNDNAGGIGGWALPKDSNSFTTPANETLKMNSGVDETKLAATSITYSGNTVSAGGELVELYNIAGVKLAEDYTIDMGQFASGVYIVRSGKQTLKIIR